MIPWQLVLREGKNAEGAEQVDNIGNVQAGWSAASKKPFQAYQKQGLVCGSYKIVRSGMIIATKIFLWKNVDGSTEMIFARTHHILKTCMHGVSLEHARRPVQPKPLRDQGKY
jgi:hypothetical protein